ncbi:DNA topoisomerase, partial [Pseudomonas sp. SIMBA_065]
RVQTPTLRLVVERDRAIASFVPQPFWTVDAHLEQDGIRFQARWQPTAAASDAVGRCIDESAAQQALRRLTQAGAAQIDSVDVER